MTRSLRTIAVVAAVGAPLILAGPATADTALEPAAEATSSPSPSPMEMSGSMSGMDSSTSTSSPTSSPSSSPSSSSSSSEESEDAQVSETPSGGADTGSGATQDAASTNTLAAGGLLLAVAAGATVYAVRRRSEA
jgi:hypothetical protein